jgi:hypothetical protein
VKGFVVGGDFGWGAGEEGGDCSFSERDIMGS